MSSTRPAGPRFPATPPELLRLREELQAESGTFVMAVSVDGPNKATLIVAADTPAPSAERLGKVDGWDLDVWHVGRRAEL